MKFLLDENFPRSAADLIEECGHEIVYDESAHCLVFQTVLKKTESCCRYAFLPAFISATEEIIASIMKSTCSFVRP